MVRELKNNTHHIKVVRGQVTLANCTTGDKVELKLENNEQLEKFIDVIFNRD